MSGPAGRLLRAELVLMTREPLTLTFVFVFPVVTMLIIGGSFGTTPTAAFDWVNPAQWYVASYLTVVIAATGLIMVPVHLASYRERGVLRRFAAAGFPRWSFVLAQGATGLVAIAAGAAILLVVAAPIYGLPPAHQLARVVLAVGLGSVAFVSLGVVLGTLLPSARAAQAVGLLLFFPSFLLGSGGPPPRAMGAGLRAVAGYLPLTRVTDAVRDPWLGTGQATGSLAIVAGLALVGAVVALQRSAR
jgi:ABC-2 type transport system permease protein